VTWTISKDFSFAASHQLHGLPAGHKCGRVHGHNYTVRVTITAGALARHGFVLDYGDLAPFGAWLDEHLDHRHLNDLVNFQPSAELLARHLHGMLTTVVEVPAGARVRVGVSETPKTWAVYEPGD
jgi:6-pyruvoyltetrahydropterin/6-carboxytetrahydropterin synthase